MTVKRAAHPKERLDLLLDGGLGVQRAGEVGQGAGEQQGRLALLGHDLIHQVEMGRTRGDRRARRAVLVQHGQRIEGEGGAPPLRGELMMRARVRSRHFESRLLAAEEIDDFARRLEGRLDLAIAVHNRDARHTGLGHLQQQQQAHQVVYAAVMVEIHVRHAKPFKRKWHAPSMPEYVPDTSNA